MLALVLFTGGSALGSLLSSRPLLQLRLSLLGRPLRLVGGVGDRDGEREPGWRRRDGERE